MTDAIIIWDEEGDDPCNVTHIAEHGISPEEVEEILLDDSLDVETSRSSGRPCKFGATYTGKFIAVFFEVASDDPLMLYPVTAYEVEP